MLPSIPQSSDEVATELRSWLDGESNTKLDNWYKEHEEHFSGVPKGYQEPNKEEEPKDKPKNEPNDEFIEASNIKEAEAYARDVLGIETVNYKGVDIKAANEWNRGLKDSFDKFPELKENFSYVGETRAMNKEVRKVMEEHWLQKYKEVNPNSSVESLRPYAKKKTNEFMKRMNVSKTNNATSWSPNVEHLNQFKGITMNGEKAKDSVKWVESMTKSVEMKWSAEGRGSIKALLDHEVGHQIDDLLGIRDLENIQNLFNSRTKEQITDELSTYAWKNNNKNKYSEMIAEGWAEYLNNPNPRPMAKEIGETIIETYNKKFK